MNFVCITGLLRNFHEKIDSIRDNLVINNNADVYMSIWDFEDGTKTNVDSDLLDLINEKLSPKKIDLFNMEEVLSLPINKELQDFYSSVNPSIRTNHLVLRWFQTHNCFQNIDDKYKYGAYIRPDISFDEPIDISQDSLCIPTGSDYCGGISDSFAYGPTNLLKIYADLGNRMMDYCKEGIPLHPETMLRYHLVNKHHLVIKRTTNRFYIRQEGFLWGGHEEAFTDDRRV